MEVFAARDAIEHYQRARPLLTEVANHGTQATERSILDLEHLYIRLGQAYEMTDERKDPEQPTRRYSLLGGS